MARRPPGNLIDNREQRESPRIAFALAALMLAAGISHFAFPRPYQRIVPRLLGDPALWVRVSGIAEIGCAGLLVHPRTRRIGGWLTMGVLLAVFPANVKMAIEGGIPGSSFPLGSPAMAWARLPLQIPLILWARRVAVRCGRVSEPALCGYGRS